MGVPVQPIDETLISPIKGLPDNCFRQGKAVEQHPIALFRLGWHLLSVQHIHSNALSGQRVLQL